MLVADVPIRREVRRGRRGSDQTQESSSVRCVKLIDMLTLLRQQATMIASLICVALLAMWITGAHGHRHATDAAHDHEIGAGHGGHSHETPELQGLSFDDTAAAHSTEHSPTMMHGDGHQDIELQGLHPAPFKHLPDAPLLILLICAVLVLARRRTGILPQPTDSPPPTARLSFLRPPLRGPPVFSVA